MKTNHKGFTIIELLITVGIIAILTAIITANFASSKSKSRDAKRVSDIVQLQLAFELYFDRCGSYPLISTTGTVTSGTPSSSWLTIVNPNCPSGITLGNFISTIPVTPSGSSYTYSINSATQPTDYVLRAILENNNPALRDDVDGTIMTVSCSEGSTTFYYCVQPR